MPKKKDTQVVEQQKKGTTKLQFPLPGLTMGATCMCVCAYVFVALAIEIGCRIINKASPTEGERSKKESTFNCCKSIVPGVRIRRQWSFLCQNNYDARNAVSIHWCVMHVKWAIEATQLSILQRKKWPFCFRFVYDRSKTNITQCPSRCVDY